MAPEADGSSERAQVVAVAGIIRDGLSRWSGSGEPASRHLPGNWPQLYAELDIAEESSQVGRALPGTHAYRGLRRAVATCMLHLTRVVTNRQHVFNMLILSPLRALTGTVQRLEAEQTRLERVAAEQEARLRRLEERLASARKGQLDRSGDERFWAGPGAAPAA